MYRIYLLLLFSLTMAQAQIMARVETQSNVRYTKRTFHSGEVYLMHKSALMTPAKVSENLIYEKEIGFVLIDEPSSAMYGMIMMTLGGKEIEKKVDWVFDYGANVGENKNNFGDVERRENGVSKVYRAGCVILPNGRDLVCELYDRENQPTVPNITLELHTDLTIVSIREFTDGQDVFTYYVKSVEIGTRQEQK